MENLNECNTCNCRIRHSDEQQSLGMISSKTARSTPSVILSILIAFFPKCPMCWAVYMSMFGSLGLAKLPYMKWLLPVMMIFLAIHLFFLYKRIRVAGYLPFIISMLGAVFIMSSRAFFPGTQWSLVAGVGMILTGSLLNNFPNVSLKLIHKKHKIA